MAYEPVHIIDIGAGCQMGLAVDDSCFIALVQRGGEWKIATHWPAPVVHAAEVLRESMLRTAGLPQPVATSELAAAQAAIRPS